MIGAFSPIVCAPWRKPAHSRAGCALGVESYANGAIFGSWPGSPRHSTGHTSKNRYPSPIGRAAQFRAGPSNSFCTGHVRRAGRGTVEVRPRFGSRSRLTNALELWDGNSVGEYRACGPRYLSSRLRHFWDFRRAATPISNAASPALPLVASPRRRLGVTSPRAPLSEARRACSATTSTPAERTFTLRLSARVGVIPRRGLSCAPGLAGRAPIRATWVYQPSAPATGAILSRGTCSRSFS